jgi:DNA (cytosine-5)-methyltransferase 1
MSSPIHSEERAEDSVQRLVRHLDLFSGIGGFALAARMVGGIETIGFSEIEPYACRVLANQFPNVPNHGDIRNIKDVPAELITGGFPCQPFSHAGKQRGAEDDRHLWPEMLRVIGESRPRWILGENVPGIINMELDNLLSDLEGIGYEAWSIVVPAVAVDARHRRDRVWIVGHADEDGKSTLPVNAEMAELQSLANAGCGRCGEPGEGEMELSRRAEAIGSGATLAYANHPGRRQQRRAESGGTQHSPAERCCRWGAEPGMGRVVDGLSRGMDRNARLRGLGNAIVPQVAAEILRAMMSVDSLANAK